MMSEVTVCITHYNRVQKLQKCLKLLEERTNVPYDVVIHNNGYINDEIREVLRELDDEGLTIIHTDENLGSAGSRSMLMDRKYDTEFVQIIDDDIYVADNWFEQVQEITDQYPDVGAVSFPFRFPNQEYIVDGGKEIEIVDGVLYREDVDYEDLVPGSGSVKVHDTPIGTTCFRTDALPDMRYDEEYKTGFGDLDRSLKAFQSDWQVRMSTSKVFVHDKQDLNEENLKSRRDFNAINESYRYFIQKWDLRLPLREHLYFKYAFAIPNKILWNVSNIKRRLGL